MKKKIKDSQKDTKRMREGERETGYYDNVSICKEVLFKVSNGRAGDRYTYICLIIYIYI